MALEDQFCEDDIKELEGRFAKVERDHGINKEDRTPFDWLNEDIDEFFNFGND